MITFAQLLEKTLKVGKRNRRGTEGIDDRALPKVVPQSMPNGGMNAIFGDQVNEGAEEWSGPLVGYQVKKHLSKSQIRNILGDEDYTKHVDGKAPNMVVFKVHPGQHDTMRVKVADTRGEHHVEFNIDKRGLIKRKTVFRRAEGVHPKIHWAVHSTWSLADELKKNKKKK